MGRLSFGSASHPAPPSKKPRSLLRKVSVSTEHQVAVSIKPSVSTEIQDSVSPKQASAAGFLGIDLRRQVNRSLELRQYGLILRIRALLQLKDGLSSKRITTSRSSVSAYVARPIWWRTVCPVITISRTRNSPLSSWRLTDPRFMGPRDGLYY
jgi:hypothetical protein